jgi:nucleotide sugar dehydrogenase
MLLNWRENLSLRNNYECSVKDRTIICVQGLGFVGLAMATVIANTFDNDVPLYTVIGIDLPVNQFRIDMINRGEMPFKSEDPHFADELEKAVLINKNLIATSDESFYSQANVLVVDVPLHIEKEKDGNYSNYKLYESPFEKAIDILGKKIKPDCLVLVETTVAPGYCEKIIKKILEDNFKSRKINSPPLIAHSYERVMPGKNYLGSIRNYYRTFSGINKKSAEKARHFLGSIINVKDFPLREEDQTEASELAKVMENSYRAVNIALIYEWTLLAEKMGVNLFSAIEGIRNRKTHNNIMEPGFGVGGYCLTKDSLLALWSAENFYNADYGLPFSKMALEVNDKMPLHTIDLILAETNIKDKKLVLLGVSYRQDVGDTRSSPSEIFYREAVKLGAQCFAHDPYVNNWPECPEVPFVAFDHSLNEMDIIVFTVRHKDYMQATKDHLLKISRRGALVVDTFNILDDDKILHLLRNDRKVIGVGKGHIRRMRESVHG